MVRPEDNGPKITLVCTDFVRPASGNKKALANFAQVLDLLSKTLVAREGLEPPTPGL
jgi:hypothetical protein